MFQETYLFSLLQIKDLVMTVTYPSIRIVRTSIGVNADSGGSVVRVE